MHQMHQHVRMKAGGLLAHRKNLIQAFLYNLMHPFRLYHGQSG
jgi:hypothetical protein